MIILNKKLINYKKKIKKLKKKKKKKKNRLLNTNMHG